VPRLLILAIAALCVWFLYRVSKDLERPVRQRLLGWLTIPVLLLLVVLGLRLGAHWLTVLGAGGWVLVRRVLPLLLRVAPFAWSGWSSWSRARRSAPRTPSEPAPSSPRMTRAEALDVLGLKEGASRDDIVASYRVLIQRVHPDKPGGSEYLASKLNQAKTTLLD